MAVNDIIIIIIIIIFLLKKKKNLGIGYTMWPFGLRVHVFCFTFSVFCFFFLPAFFDFGRQILLLWTVYALFTHCVYTIHVLKNIKNRSHDIIYTFKYYFAIVFSVFSFQFSATISSIQTHPMSGSTYWMKKNYKGMELEGLFIFNYFLN